MVIWKTFCIRLHNSIQYIDLIVNIYLSVFNIAINFSNILLHVDCFYSMVIICFS